MKTNDAADFSAKSVLYELDNAETMINTTLYGGLSEAEKFQILLKKYRDVPLNGAKSLLLPASSASVGDLMMLYFDIKKSSTVKDVASLNTRLANHVFDIPDGLKAQGRSGLVKLNLVNWHMAAGPSSGWSSKSWYSQFPSLSKHYTAIDTLYQFSDRQRAAFYFNTAREIISNGGKTSHPDIVYQGYAASLLGETNGDCVLVNSMTYQNRVFDKINTQYATGLHQRLGVRVTDYFIWVYNQLKTENIDPFQVPLGILGSPIYSRDFEKWVMHNGPFNYTRRMDLYIKLTSSPGVKLYDGRFDDDNFITQRVVSTDVLERAVGNAMCTLQGVTFVDAGSFRANDKAKRYRNSVK